MAASRLSHHFARHRCAHSLWDFDCEKKVILSGRQLLRLPLLLPPPVVPPGYIPSSLSSFNCLVFLGQTADVPFAVRFSLSVLVYTLWWKMMSRVVHFIFFNSFVQQSRFSTPLNGCEMWTIDMYDSFQLINLVLLWWLTVYIVYILLIVLNLPDEVTNRVVSSSFA